MKTDDVKRYTTAVDNEKKKLDEVAIKAAGAERALEQNLEHARQGSAKVDRSLLQHLEDAVNKDYKQTLLQARELNGAVNAAIKKSEDAHVMVDRALEDRMYKFAGEIRASAQAYDALFGKLLKARTEIETVAKIQEELARHQVHASGKVQVERLAIYQHGTSTCVGEAPRGEYDRATGILVTQNTSFKMPASDPLQHLQQEFTVSGRYINPNSVPGQSDHGQFKNDMKLASVNGDRKTLTFKGH